MHLLRKLFWGSGHKSEAVRIALVSLSKLEVFWCKPIYSNSCSYPYKFKERSVMRHRTRSLSAQSLKMISDQYGKVGYFSVHQPDHQSREHILQSHGLELLASCFEWNIKLFVLHLNVVVLIRAHTDRIQTSSPDEPLLLDSVDEVTSSTNLIAIWPPTVLHL